MTISKMKIGQSTSFTYYMYNWSDLSKPVDEDIIDFALL